MRYYLAILLFIHVISYSQQSQYSFEELIGKASPKNSENPYHLQNEAFIAFKKMQQAAFNEGIKIEIASSFRSFQHQKRIWDKKYNYYKSQGYTEKKIIEKITQYSTIPGTSRHHWGTDIDVYQKIEKLPKNILTPSNYSQKGPFFSLKKWMDENASKFCFELVYTSNPSRTGFKYEPWHYSYAPISKKMLQLYSSKNCTDSISKLISKNTHSLNSNYIKQYYRTHILGINPTLLTQ